ncbi:MAG: translation initiation factor IF-2 [Candidatus Omnitrophica bacterium]|nr:translation initiation factor IF-2 [Candidatus Omnitrophota bacterium]
MRVHELAKELGFGSKEITAKIQELGGSVKGHMSLVDEALIPKIRAAFSSQKAVSTVKSTVKSADSLKTKPSKTHAVETKSPVSKVPEKLLVPEEKKPVPKLEKIEAPQPASEPVQPAPKKQEPQNTGPVPIFIRFPITVGHFSAETKQSIPTVIKTLMTIGVFANVNQFLNREVAMSLAEVLKIKIEKLPDEEEKLLHKHVASQNDKQLKSRPPVVTMMGHVDHGKTSLLDAIRSTNVVATEKGAITQHIGAYGVDIPDKGHVTFLDTPGHEAFTAMRARGANVTDVVVLVVAADDGIMPQTIEAIHHAQEAQCPIVVAINKTDLPSANVKKVLGELQHHGLVPEAWGGKTICVEVSAKTGKGIPEILDMLLLEAEVLELKANYDCEASGTVIEAHLTKGSGPVATMIVQRGTLKVGDVVVCGVYFGRVRALRNDRGKQVKEATPSYAASVMGLAGVPEAGDTFLVVEDEKIARRITEQRALEKREKDLSGGSAKHLSLENLYDRLSEGDFKELKIIIKADVQGSMEALAQSLEKVSNDQCQVRVIHSGVGPISESDVMLAAASDAIILGFHVRADGKAAITAQKEGVDLRYYNIIYEVIEDVQKAMEGLLEPTYSEVIEGRVEIRQTFQSSKAGTIGGGYVIKGKIVRINQVRVLRNNVVIFQGKISSLKRFKDDVRDVAQGFECGISIEGFKELQPSDIIESFRIEKVATKLTSS